MRSWTQLCLSFLYSDFIIFPTGALGVLKFDVNESGSQHFSVVEQATWGLCCVEIQLPCHCKILFCYFFPSTFFACFSRALLSSILDLLD